MIRLCGPREASPHARLHEPEEQPVPLLRIQCFRVPVEVPDHDRDREAPEEHLVVVQAQAAADQVEASVDPLDRPLEAVLHLFRALVVEKAELGLAGEHCVHRTQQPVEVEVVTGSWPSSLRACFISSRASGQSAQILASARSPLESFVPPLFTRLKMSTTTSSDLVGSGDLLDVQVHIRDAEQAAEAPHVVANLRGESAGCAVSRATKLAQPGGAASSSTP